MNPNLALPAPSTRRVAVNVTSDALRQVRRGHPWIWDGSVVRASHEGQPGDLAVVFDNKRRFAAIGLWDPNAAIAVRVLHHGSPRTIDADFFADRLLDAFARRDRLHNDPSTTAYRVVHGENDQLPGLVVDRYDSTLVVKLDTAVWVPYLSMVVPILVDIADADRVVLRASRRVSNELPTELRDSPTIVGSLPEGPIAFQENGLAFHADVERGQKTGHFLDQRDNRSLVGSHCADARVLDVFCNSGGFSVYAAAAGAHEVHSVDSSRHAIDATKQHIELNRGRLGFHGNHHAVVGDAFDVLGDLAARHKRFDVVIVDPPSFAPNAASVAAALRSYGRLTRLAVDVLADGGQLFQASCSSRVTSDDFFHVVSSEIEALGFALANPIRTGHAVDHPVGFEHGEYLKALLTTVLPNAAS